MALVRLIAALLLLWPSLAMAQSVQQSGTVTPGHPTMWTTNGVVQDAGTSSQGKLTTLGITSSNLQSQCINNGPATGPYNSLCFGINGAQAQITLSNFGGAPAIPLQCVVNGVTSNCLSTAGSFLPLSGGTLSGPLILSGDPTLSLGAATKHYVDTSLAVGGPFLPLVGGALSGPGNLSVGGTLGVTGAFTATNATYDIRVSGAACNGLTDDTSVLQSWLNTLLPGAKVIIPATVQCLFDSADLTVPPGLTIEGQGGFLETAAGPAAGNLTGPALIHDPAHTLVVSSGVMLRNFKILRQGLLPAPTTGQVNAAVAAWTAEAPLYQTNAATASGLTLPFSNTTGISNGMQAWGQNIPFGATVTSFVANTSVTFSAVQQYPVPLGAYVHFGSSMGVRVPASTGGVSMDTMFILGFNTGILSQSGRLFFHDIREDNIVNLNIFNAGDASYIRSIHATTIYGGTSGTGSERPGPSFLISQSDGLYLGDSSAIGWMIGFSLFGSSGVTCDRCWAESTVQDHVTVTTGFKISGLINVINLVAPVSSAMSIGFDLGYMQGIVTIADSITAPAGDGTGVAHFQLGTGSKGNIFNALINTANVLPFNVLTGVGRWRIIGPIINTPSPTNWIVGASSDLALVDLLNVHTNASNDNVVQTHLHEKVWVSRDGQTVSTDGSPQEPIAIESLTAGAGDTPLLGFYRNGTELGHLRTGGSNTELDLLPDAITTFRVILPNFAVNGTGSPSLLVTNKSTPAGTDYLQMGAANTSGAYIQTISPGNAPLYLLSAGTGAVNLGTSGTTAVNIGNSGSPTTLGSGVLFGSALDSSATAFDKHISLYSTTFGFGVTTANLNYVVPSASNHSFYNGSNQTAQFGGTAITLGAPSAVTAINVGNSGATTTVSGPLTLSGIVSAANCTGQPSKSIISTTGTGALIQCP